VRWRRLLAGVALLAFAVRFLHIRALANTPVFAVLLGDSKRYVEWGAEIAGGNWIGSGAFYQAPLYPYFLGVLFSVFGESLDVIRMAQAIAGTVSCVLVAIAGRCFFDWRTGLVAGAALALYPPAIFFDGHIQKASLDLLLMAAVLLAVGTYQVDARARWLMLLGVALGCLTLNRENARVLIPVLVLWLWLWNRDRTLKHRLEPIAVFTLAVLLVVVPVALRNYAVAGELLFSTSQLGSNFYIGNHAGASGVYEPLLPERGNVVYEQEDAVRLAREATGRALSPSEVSRYWVDRTLADIRQDVAGWVRLLSRKALLSVNAVEAMDTESLEFHADHSIVLGALRPLTFGVWLTLAVLGAIVAARDGRRVAVLHAIAAVFMLSVVVFFVQARYRFAVVPIVLLFGAAAIAGLGAAWRDRRRRTIVAAACAIAIAMVVNRPMPATSDESYSNFGAELVRLERPQEAIPLLVEAAERLPDEPSVHRDLAFAYLKAGDPASAVREYAAVARLDPNDPANHRELAFAIQRLVEMHVRTASRDVAEGRIDRAISGLQEAAAIARASGLDATTRDLDVTIAALQQRGRRP
jgi:4-amino-4-deoxy-L-arabinose transferase-like glycosyltransferase